VLRRIDLRRRTLSLILRQIEAERQKLEAAKAALAAHLQPLLAALGITGGDGEKTMNSRGVAESRREEKREAEVALAGV